MSVLPGYHVFTGCDTTSPFAGKGKQTCWNFLLKSTLSILQAFTNLGKILRLSENDHRLMEDFLCQLYQSKTQECHLTKLRWNIFRQSQADAEKLPPTPAALRHHTHYQCMIWSHGTVAVMNLPPPASNGWEWEFNGLLKLWYCCYVSSYIGIS